MLFGAITHIGSIQVEELHDTRITDDIRVLASGPVEYAKKYKGFVVNGFRFHTHAVQRRRKTQNSGVMLEAITNTFSSARDDNPIVGDVTYYGVLQDIIELDYGADRRVALFKCDWIPQNGSSIKVDENGFTTLNFKNLKATKEPYILASQAKQVFYVADRVNKGWKTVIKTTARETYEMDEQTGLDDVETHLQSDTPAGPQVDENIDIELVRGDLDGTYVDNKTVEVDDAS